MATKTITIDLAAYNRLKLARTKDETFSQVIKRVVKEPMDVRAFEKKMKSHPLSHSAIKAIEEHVERRHKITRPSR
ncbi:MAG: hypothetical protein A2Y07_02970 [Planctomycetes bacterium GWF2_50_10]|nr:MAG: hypothetical protein A2Y07_02970 [Planctomycetes bacterium GWF2_50_10]